MKKTRLRNNDAGAALLAIMLIVVVSASALLLSRLNDNVQPYLRQSESMDVLGQAKAALITYALKYPEDHTEEWLGYLPCPDRTDPTDLSEVEFIGAAGTSCSQAGGTNIGRLPWKTLDIGELRDHMGERLWYAVSENYKNNTKVLAALNSDAPGTLKVDGNDDIDIVAVIFAPGEPVGNQDRNDDPLAAGNYLENDNADNDVDFVSDASGEFNDRLITITQQELMKVVEKRVVGEARKALLSYRSNHDAFPWLSPFEKPEDSAFRGQVDTWEGHLPYHWSVDTPGFTTSLRWTWNIDAGTASTTSWGTVSDDCLRNVDCSDALFPTITSVNTASIDCVWSDKDSADCEKSNLILMSSTPCTFCDSGTCFRFYIIDFPAYSGGSTINDPSSSDPRTRDVVLSGSLVPQDDAVEIADVYIASTPSCTSEVKGRGWLDLTPGTTGSIGTHDIQYDIDIDAGELPAWFVNNDWHELVYIAYSDAEDPPGGATECTPGTDCLTLNGVNGTNDNKRAVAVIAGRDLTVNRPSGSMADYFEAENSDECASGCAGTPFDKTLLKDTVTDSFNDQLRVILETP